MARPTPPWHRAAEAKTGRHHLRGQADGRGAAFVAHNCCDSGFRRGWGSQFDVALQDRSSAMPRLGPGRGPRPPVAAEHVFHAPRAIPADRQYGVDKRGYADLLSRSSAVKSDIAPVSFEAKVWRFILRPWRFDVHLVDVKATSKPATRRLREECSFDLHPDQWVFRWAGRTGICGWIARYLTRRGSACWTPGTDAQNHEVKPRELEEVETPGVRCIADQCSGNGGVGRGIC